MTKKSKQSFVKHARERARQQKKMEKETRKTDRRREAEELKAQIKQDRSNEDPDIAGIVPGPQPKIEE